MGGGLTAPFYLDFYVRDASSKDVPAITHIFNSYRNDSQPGRVADYEEEDFAAYIGVPHCKLLIAEAWAPELRGTILGFALAYDMVTWGYLDILCVRPEHRGHNIGSHLLSCLETGYADRWGELEVCYYEDDDIIEGYLKRRGYIDHEDVVWCVKPLKDSEQKLRKYAEREAKKDDGRRGGN